MLLFGQLARAMNTVSPLFFCTPRKTSQYFRMAYAKVRESYSSHSFLGVMAQKRDPGPSGSLSYCYLLR